MALVLQSVLFFSLLAIAGTQSWITLDGVKKIPADLKPMVKDITPVIESNKHVDRDLQGLEMFHGDGQVLRNMRRAGFKASGFDWHDDDDDCYDISTLMGLTTAIWLVMRLSIGAF